MSQNLPLGEGLGSALLNQRALQAGLVYWTVSLAFTLRFCSLVKQSLGNLQVFLF